MRAEPQIGLPNSYVVAPIPTAPRPDEDPREGFRRALTITSKSLSPSNNADRRVAMDGAGPPLDGAMHRGTVYRRSKSGSVIAPPGGVMSALVRAALP
jgi:hypothetical protein